MSVDDTKVEVFFVDYGDTEWVFRSFVQPIHSSLLQVHYISRDTCELFFTLKY